MEISFIPVFISNADPVDKGGRSLRFDRTLRSNRSSVITHKIQDVLYEMVKLPLNRSLALSGSPAWMGFSDHGFQFFPYFSGRWIYIIINNYK